MWIKHTLLVSASSVLLAALACGEQEPRPMHVVLCVGADKAELVKFTRYLEANYYVQCNWVEASPAARAITHFTGLQHLADADVVVSALYRTNASPEQLDVLKKHFRSKPVVGLRTAHLGFASWPEADAELFGVVARNNDPLLQSWSRIIAERRQRVFYTRHDADDVKNEEVRDLVVRAIFWAAQRDDKELRKTGS